MAEPVVEIHVPLVPRPGLSADAYPFPWIREIDDFLADLEERGETEVFDEGEEVGKVYIFLITGPDPDRLISIAAEVAARPGVPSGAFAMLTDDDAEAFGRGRRIALTYRPDSA
jgi:hypothetical protein